MKQLMNKTIMVVALLAIADRVRPEAAGVIARLKALGLAVVLPTGDAALSATAVVGRSASRVWSRPLSTSDAADDPPCVDLVGRRNLL